MAVLLALMMVAIILGSIIPVAIRAEVLPDLISAHGVIIDRQISLTLWITGIILVLSHIGIIMAVLKFQRKEGKKPSYFHGNTTFELITVVFSLVLFVGLNLMGQGVWAEMHLNEKPKDALQIEVNAMQFNWNFRYAGRDGKFDDTKVTSIDDGDLNFIGIIDYDETDDVMEGTITIPMDTNIVLHIKSRDVLHSFNVPELRVKQDAVPGLVVSIPFMVIKEKTLKFSIDPKFATDLDGGKVSPELVAAFEGNKIKLYKDPSASTEKAGQQWVVSSGSKVLRQFEGKDITRPGYIKHRLVLEDGKINVYRANYEVACTELCGSNHFTMRSQLNLMPKADFDVWYEARKKAAAGE